MNESEARAKKVDFRYLQGYISLNNIFTKQFLHTLKELIFICCPEQMKCIIYRCTVALLKAKHSLIQVIRKIEQYKMLKYALRGACRDSMQGPHGLFVLFLHTQYSSQGPAQPIY